MMKYLCKFYKMMRLLELAMSSQPYDSYIRQDEDTNLNYEQFIKGCYKITLSSYFHFIFCAFSSSVKAVMGVRATFRNSTSEPSACRAICPREAVPSEP